MFIHAFSVVRHIDNHLLGLFLQRNGNLPCASHGVHGILNQVLDYPLQQLHILDDGECRMCCLDRCLNLHFAADPCAHVIHRFLQCADDIAFLQLGFTSNLGETVRNSAEPIDVGAHLRNQIVVGIAFGKQLLPRVEGRYRRA